MAYRSTIDLNNLNNSHTLAINFCQKHANGRKLRILEVGCSEGYVGGFLHELGHYVVGVESNSSSATIAKKYLDEVHINFVEVYFSEHAAEQFDIIIYGDVLEHLLDPELVLNSSIEALSDGGVIVTSLPNVTHNSVRAMLLSGRWDYADLGILDRTHLHFYSKDGITELFQRVGCKVEEIAEVRLSAQQVIELCKLDINLDKVKLVERECADDPSGEVFQYVSVARPIRSKPLRVVGYVPQKDLGICTIRVNDPLLAWSSEYGGQYRYRSFGEICTDDLAWGDVFVIQRLADPGVANLIRILHEMNKKVIFEIDDLLIDIPDFLIHHQVNKAALKVMEQVIAKADIVTVTTQRLKDALLSLNSNIQIVPNIAYSLGSSLTSHNSQDPISLIVASTDAILLDFIVPVLKEIQSRYDKSMCQVIAIGPPAQYLRKNGIEVLVHPILSHNEFKQLISGVVNPIGVIPLDDSRFSSCKSPVKFFDYSLAGVPVICSNVPPYVDFIENGKTGFLVNNNVQDWLERIEFLMSSSVDRQTVSKAASEFVKQNYSLDTAAAAWEKAMSSLVINRQKRRLSPNKENDIKILSIPLNFRLNTIFSLFFYQKVIHIIRHRGAAYAFRRAIEKLRTIR
jgi:2-polyprenyl-3-methyl-5-hydroxy-6-metoxy-1,4-benzoquinol methylase